MNTEIEMKAHVQDKEALRLLLSEKAEYLGYFEKEDTYWYPQPGGSQALMPYGIRIRKEKRSLPDGSEGSAIYATFKRKEVIDGIELNDEREFKVSPASEFEYFLNLAGIHSGKHKQKRGWAFSKRDITAELVEVEGLGWFIELEIITDDKQPDTVSERRKQLLDFFDELGIERTAIESRFYSEILKTSGV